MRVAGTVSLSADIGMKIDFFAAICCTDMPPILYDVLKKVQNFVVASLDEFFSCEDVWDLDDFFRITAGQRFVWSVC